MGTIYMGWIVAQGVALLSLMYGSYKDVKTREIPDTPWMAMGAAGVVLRMVDHQWKMMALSFGVALLLGFILAVSGLFGGADVKAFLALSVLIPIYPGVVLPVFVVSVFNNLVIIRIGEIFSVLGYNAAKGNRYLGEIPLWKKILLYMTGIPRSIEALDYRFLPLQDTDGTLHLMPDIDTDIEQFKAECKLKEVWVTYGSPMIVYLTASCVIAFVNGDIILHLIYLLT